MLRPRGSKWLPSPPLHRWVVVVLRCALISGLRSVCVGIEVEIGVWFRRLSSWIWVWRVSAFGLLDFRGHGGDGGGGGSFCWWFDL